MALVDKMIDDSADKGAGKTAFEYAISFVQRRRFKLYPESD